MKKKSLVIASLAGLTFLTTASAFTFADTTGSSSDNTDSKPHNRMMQSKLGIEKKEGFNVHVGIGSGAGMWLNQNMQAVKDAIVKNDYTAYLSAYEKGKMTQDQFNQVVKIGQSKEGIDVAIANNDYTAYLVAIKGTTREGKVTQVQFTAMVSKQQQRLAIHTAIANNDYTAYLAAIKGTAKEGKVTQAQFTAIVNHI